MLSYYRFVSSAVILPYPIVSLSLFTKHQQLCTEVQRAAMSMFNSPVNTPPPKVLNFTLKP